MLTLTYTIEPSENGLDYQFADESIEFRCNYARTIDVDDFEIQFDNQPASIQNVGTLKYKLEVNTGGSGQMSTMVFKTDHNITGVQAT